MTTPPSSQPPAGIKRKKRKPFDWSTAFILTLTCAAAALVYFRDGPDKFFEILHHDLRLFGDMLIKVAAGCLLGAFLARLLPREVVSRWIGAESGFVGLLVATFLGTILPGGPITIYPVAAALLVAGADVGATIAFITSWTLMGFTRALVWEIPFFGTEFVGWRLLLSAPLPILAGIMARLIVNRLRPHWGQPT